MEQWKQPLSLSTMTPLLVGPSLTLAWLEFIHAHIPHRLLYLHDQPLILMMASHFLMLATWMKTLHLHLLTLLYWLTQFLVLLVTILPSQMNSHRAMLCSMTILSSIAIYFIYTSSIPVYMMGTLVIHLRLFT